MLCAGCSNLSIFIAMLPFPSFAIFLTWFCLGLFLITIRPNTSLAQTKSASFLQRADSLQTLGLYPLAIAQYQKAAKLFEPEKNWEGYVRALNGIGQALNGIGHSHYMMDRLDTAFNFLSMSLQVGEDMLPAQHPQLAQSFFYLGKYYSVLDEPEKAIEAHQKALEIRVKIYGENHEQVANSYYYLEYTQIRASSTEHLGYFCFRCIKKCYCVTIDFEGNLK